MQSSWRELIAEMRVWKREHEVAVHKPLLILMILARAQEGGENCFRFKDLVDPLQKALLYCGADTKAFRPEYPFWHLKTDGFWTIDNEEQFEMTNPRQSPHRKKLLDNNAVARVPDHLWRQVLDDPILTKKLIASILKQYWPDPSLHSQVIEYTGVRVGP